MSRAALAGALSMRSTPAFHRLRSARQRGSEYSDQNPRLCIFIDLLVNHLIRPGYRIGTRLDEIHENSTVAGP